eukprot:COSAG05_NODE_6149_length_1012_cov_2.161008_2_plen_31_part_01
MQRTLNDLYEMRLIFFHACLLHAIRQLHSQL